MSEKFSLKDHLFNKKSVTYFADLFYAQDKNFPKDSFIKNILADFPELELKQRITRITTELRKTLSDDFSVALETIIKALPPELDPTLYDDDFGDFILAPCGEYISMYGCAEEYLEISLHGLKECTKRFSVEFPIRHFINNFPKQTLNFLTACAQDKNYHIRRLASEGTRPTLPWAINVQIDYTQPLKILDMLFSDSTRYVTRSVANHMNDISKKDPALVLHKLTQWQKTSKQHDQEMKYIMNHSLRTLVKKGNKQALELLGYSSNPKILIHNFKLLTPIVHIGKSLKFSADILSQEDQNLMIDYVIYFQMKTGVPKPKTFKIKKGSCKKGEIISFSKKHPLKIMTTKKLYPGKHIVDMYINGEKSHEFSFELVL